MNDIERFLVELQQARDETFVRQAGWALHGLLQAIDHHWLSEGLYRHLRQHGPAVGAYVRQHPGFMAITRRLFEQYGSSLGEEDVIGDPTVLTDLSAFVAHLADEFPSALPSPAKEEAERTLAGLQPRMAADLVSAVQPQALLLTDVIWRIEQFVSRRLAPGGRVVLLEFPVGNSIPTKLLDRILRREGHNTCVIRAALSRNDSKGRGVTRRQLLEAKLTGAGVKKGDLVVLIDEWLSGSNFRNLTELLRKLPAVREALFLPVALLTEASATEGRFASHVQEHDLLLRRLGEDGSAWRFTFPRLDTRVEREGYFFWSEFDRLAGYRKFKIVGSYVSSIRAILKTLTTDREAMRRARVHLLATVAQDRASGGAAPEVTPAALADGGVIDRLFTESYHDYLQCEKQLEQLEDSTNRGEVGDIVEDIRRVTEKIHAVIDGRPARTSVILALAYSQTEQIVDPEDPYHLDGHAPAVVDLGGGFGRWSTCVLDALEALTLGRKPSQTPPSPVQDAGAVQRDAALTTEEHAEARRRAYFFALERGGGRLPPYDPGRAHDDFCRAAGQVIAARTSG
jgi:hypothetical protein